MSNVRTKQDAVIVALDVGSAREALDLVRKLRGGAGMFKVGSELFLAEGPDVVRAIVGNGERVFLDLKLHDIPHTVSRAAVEAGALGISMLTLHASGGPDMIRATVNRLDDSYGEARPLVVAVTVLTSINREILYQTGVGLAPADQVMRLAGMAWEAGADGIVCSPVEIRQVRKRFGPDFKIVAPGVRMRMQSAGDQKRVATPREALDAGADWIVVGRYVNQSEDPQTRLAEITRSLDGLE